MSFFTQVQRAGQLTFEQYPAWAELNMPNQDDIAAVELVKSQAMDYSHRKKILDTASGWAGNGQPENHYVLYSGHDLAQLEHLSKEVRDGLINDIKDTVRLHYGYQFRLTYEDNTFTLWWDV